MTYYFIKFNKSIDKSVSVQLKCQNILDLVEIEAKHFLLFTSSNELMLHSTAIIIATELIKLSIKGKQMNLKNNFRINRTQKENNFFSASVSSSTASTNILKATPLIINATNATQRHEHLLNKKHF